MTTTLHWTPQLKIRKMCPEAVLPTKAHPTDSGLDITIIGVHKQLSPNVTLYKTGLQIAPERGYYTELIARSSLMKLDRMLTNGTGIIDNSYRGELLVSLYNFGNKELELPLKVAQLVPRQIVNLSVVEVESLDETERGQGGFGSSGQ